MQDVEQEQQRGYDNTEHSYNGTQLFKDQAETHPAVWQLRLQALIFHLDHLLTRREWRKSCVRYLAFKFRADIPIGLSDLLRSLPRLRELTITFLNVLSDLLIPRHQRPADPQTLLQLLANLSSTPLTQLKGLRITIVKDWIPTVNLITRVFPDLERLHLGGRVLHIRSTSEVSVAIGSNGYHGLGLKALRNLKELHVEEMNSTFVPTLSKLIDGSPKLEVVSLKDEPMLWFPDLTGSTSVDEADDNQSLLDRLSKLKHVKRLHVSSNCFQGLCEIDGWRAVEDLRITWSTSALRSIEALALASASASTSNDNADREELIHCRTKAPLPNNGFGGVENLLSGCMTDTSSSSWEEHAYHKDREIPVRVLAAVYGISGVSVTGKQPARGMEMDQKGWDLLKTWEKQDESWY
ncbi:uncharacterized protein I303_106106 [Kwoniella dejecticola CBS 10117]|uniref:Uncharacterized protein n=1 Tax=Kwoniella dejecticola CBS 10117 TaxID=1296121 RepID=A0A1A6A1B5_9TREE|nr:uncharacterized protein I303_06125 [Kwoniella dejecticola CBS 10117]OBR83842.1 hypothetical protein I303_06125 [Kwoniella dejecticola CBS 10117]